MRPGIHCMPAARLCSGASRLRGISCQWHVKASQQDVSGLQSATPAAPRGLVEQTVEGVRARGDRGGAASTSSDQGGTSGSGAAQDASVLEGYQGGGVRARSLREASSRGLPGERTQVRLL